MQNGKAVVERLKRTLDPASHEANAVDASSHFTAAEAVQELAETWHKEAAEMDSLLRCCCLSNLSCMTVADRSGKNIGKKCCFTFKRELMLGACKPTHAYHAKVLMASWQRLKPS